MNEQAAQRTHYSASEYQYPLLMTGQVKSKNCVEYVESTFFMSSFVKINSVLSEEESKMPKLIRGPDGCYLPSTWMH